MAAAGTDGNTAKQRRWTSRGKGSIQQPFKILTQPAENTRFGKIDGVEAVLYLPALMRGLIFSSLALALGRGNKRVKGLPANRHQLPEVLAKLADYGSACVDHASNIINCSLQAVPLTARVSISSRPVAFQSLVAPPRQSKVNLNQGG
jgi:hypothetical protein